MRVGDLSEAAFAMRMAGRGVVLRISPVTVRIRSSVPAYPAQVHDLYRDYDLVADTKFADVDVRMVRAGGARTPRVQFVVDGTTPFEPFPLAHAFPMFEWGLNWVFAQRTHTHLLLHAAVVERGRHALVLPAYPGAGKSTLAASLACRGWRLLSDEFGAVAGGGEVVPFVRPPSIKNAAIDVLRAFAPEASFGTIFPDTRKGAVAHVRARGDAVARGSERARIGWVVFPEFRVGANVAIERLGQTESFTRLAGHAFNYEVVGERGFRAVAAIVRRCACHTLRYGSLDAAHAALDTLLLDTPPA